MNNQKKSNSAVDQQWESILSPTELKQSLVAAGLYLVAYEQLKEVIIERIRFFYSDGYFDDGKWKISKEYESEVRSKHKRLLDASVIWLVESEAFTSEDKTKLDDLTLCRNELAHDLSSFVVQPNSSQLIRRVDDIKSLIRKTERWWFANFELSVNPAYKNIDQTGIQIENVLSMTEIVIQILQKVALGDEEESVMLLRQWHAQSSRSKSASRLREEDIDDD
jgi:hypothetical protein